jgi:hypothetical protein
MGAEYGYYSKHVPMGIDNVLRKGYGRPKKTMPVIVSKNND